LCLAIPVQIKQIDGINAVVEVGGVTRSQPRPGAQARINDYVLLRGYAIRIVDEKRWNHEVVQRDGGL
jgi:hydrogenase maturation factor